MEFEIPEGVRTGPAVQRARAATELLTQVEVFTSEVSRLRREAMDELKAGGDSNAAIGRAVGMDPSRVSRIFTKSTPPERVLFSQDGGGVLIALGSKLEHGRAEPSDMISRDAAEAYDLIKDALRTFDVGCSREVVPAPGHVDLNRDNLVVIGSPKVLPIVGQVMGSDPTYGFAADEFGRHLVDRRSGQVYRSPRDETGEPADRAYIGRLPRPDGLSSFLYIAGIHAPGTHGAARYLVDNAAELYRTVKNRRFSMLIEAEYDPESQRRITGTRIVGEISLHN